MLIPSLDGRAPQPRRDRLRARIVEAHPVEQRPVRGKPKETRLRISRLRQRRHRADLHEPEPQRPQRVERLARLVEPRRHTDGIGKADAEALPGQRGVAHLQQRTGRGALRRRE
jgi:hypothetical protein